MKHNKKKIIIANWKMNGSLTESMQRAKQFRMNVLRQPVSCEIVVCPPYTILRDMAEKIPGTEVKLGGQNCHHEKDGAYTGEISAKMLRDMTCEYVILGHSERRLHSNEGSELVQKKAKAALDEKLTTVICVGETAYERDNDLAKIVIREQLMHSIPANANSNNIIIAYEPVWAIGTGQTPSIEQIEETHGYIRQVIQDELKQFRDGVRVVYGGSTGPENARALLSAKGVDGLLVGKASLDIDQFWKMIESAA